MSSGNGFDLGRTRTVVRFGAWALRLSSLLCAVVTTQIPGVAEVERAAASEPTGDLFSAPAVRLISLRIQPRQWQDLEENHRRYVEAAVSEGGRTSFPVGLRLKGSAGSFRSLDDKPSFTLAFDRFNSGTSFHGLRKIHLNNSVEDPSYLNEMIGSELFRMAGLPAPGVTHARVELNGRSLGLYVLKEGFTEDLARRYFVRDDGTWSEDDPVIEDNGSGQSSPPESTAGIAPIPGCRDLENRFDLDRFISFMALEIMVGHRDGYCLARNNFRTYLDPVSGRKSFLPHGMDQLFGNPDLPWNPNFSGNVARAVMATSEGQERYRTRFRELSNGLLIMPRLTYRVDQIVAGLKPFLSARERARLDVESAAVRDRIVRRAESLERQLAAADSSTIEFVERVAGLGRWTRVDFSSEGSLEERIAPDGIPALSIRAGPATSASWRTTVRLKRGRYRFEGSSRAEDYEPLPFGRNHGAALRVSGKSNRSQPLAGHEGWVELKAAFTVDQPDESVELVCEFRASGGQAWFDRNSLRLVRVD